MPTSAQRERFTKTRRDHASETFEDYTEAVDEICSTADSCRVRDLALFMRVSHVTVVRIVRRLVSEGLANKDRHGPITLTQSGARLARAARNRHATVLSFLRALGVPRAQASKDAEGIEHHASDATLRAMRRFIARQTL
ncbi:MAG: transcriptional regulator [Phycisphaerales bacterium]|nr:transcriptional regulator [Phycisphaerales bacterium]